RLPAFMEINPRFWNSLHMAVIAGVDFPWLLLQSFTGEPRAAPVTEYRIGARCRNLLPGDLLHALANPNRRRLSPPLWAGRSVGIEDDMLSRDDPLPVLGFLIASALYALDLRMWRFYFRR